MAIKSGQLKEHIDWRVFIESLHEWQKRADEWLLTKVTTGDFPEIRYAAGYRNAINDLIGELVKNG